MNGRQVEERVSALLGFTRVEPRLQNGVEGRGQHSSNGISGRPMDSGQKGRRGCSHPGQPKLSTVLGVGTGGSRTEDSSAGGAGIFAHWLMGCFRPRENY